MCAEESGNRDRTCGEETGNVPLCAQRQSTSALPVEGLHTHSLSLLLILTERGIPECMRAVMIAELSPSPSSTAPCSHHKTEKRRAAVRREREKFSSAFCSPSKSQRRQ